MSNASTPPKKRGYATQGGRTPKVKSASNRIYQKDFAVTVQAAESLHRDNELFAKFKEGVDAANESGEITFCVAGRELNQTSVTEEEYSAHKAGTPLAEDHPEARYHLQCFVRFAQQKSPIVAAKFFANKMDVTSCHVGPRIQPEERLDAYCRKEGDVYIEVGTLKGNKGSRSDIFRFQELVEDGSIESYEDAIRECFSVCLRGNEAVIRNYIELKKPRIPSACEEDLQLLENVRRWQLDLLRWLGRSAKKRDVRVYHDSDGGSGKTCLTRLMPLLFPNKHVCVVRPGKKTDMAMIMKERMDILIIDIPRSSAKNMQWAIIEELDDGFFASYKYSSSMKYVKDVKIVVFSNSGVPDIEEKGDFHSVRYEYNKNIAAFQPERLPSTMGKALSLDRYTEFTIVSDPSDPSNTPEGKVELGVEGYKLIEPGNAGEREVIDITEEEAAPDDQVMSEPVLFEDIGGQRFTKMTEADNVALPSGWNWVIRTGVKGRVTWPPIPFMYKQNDDTVWDMKTGQWTTETPIYYLAGPEARRWFRFSGMRHEAMSVEEIVAEEMPEVALLPVPEGSNLPYQRDD